MQGLKLDADVVRMMQAYGWGKTGGMKVVWVSRWG